MVLLFSLIAESSNSFFNCSFLVAKASTISWRALKKPENLSLYCVNLLDKKSNSNHLEIITQKEVLKELNISPNTLKSWERKGLARLEPPIERTRTVYYKRQDIIKFLST